MRPTRRRCPIFGMDRGTPWPVKLGNKRPRLPVAWADHELVVIKPGPATDKTPGEEWGAGDRRNEAREATPKKNRTPLHIGTGRLGPYADRAVKPGPVGYLCFDARPNRITGPLEPAGAAAYRQRRSVRMAGEGGRW